jgi:hypothetical protein
MKADAPSTVVDHMEDTLGRDVGLQRDRLEFGAGLLESGAAEADDDSGGGLGFWDMFGLAVLALIVLGAAVAMIIIGVNKLS